MAHRAERNGLLRASGTEYASRRGNSVIKYSISMVCEEWMGEFPSSRVAPQEFIALVPA
nr:hypothetical protein [Blautia sp. An249]